MNGVYGVRESEGIRVTTNKANTLSSAVSLPPAAKPDSTIYANDTPSPAKGGYTNITQDVEKDAEGDNIYEDPDKPTMELKPMGK